jgi:hypothetical protein
VKSTNDQRHWAWVGTPSLETNQLPPLVALPEVPGYLGDISRSKVYELVSAGELTRVHIGRRAFVSGESITAFLSRVLTSSGAV